MSGSSHRLPEKNYESGSCMRKNWSREELSVLVTIFHSSSFSIGDDERSECKRMAKAFGRTASAVDRQWRNIADIKDGKEGLQVSKLISECVLEYFEDPKNFQELALLICRQRNWDVADLIMGAD